MPAKMSAVLKASEPKPVERRIGEYDWATIGADLDAFGCATLPKLLAPQECDDIAALYPHEEHFRSHIHMARHGFGKGEYRYFKYPLARADRRITHRALSAMWCPSPTPGTSA